MSENKLLEQIFTELSEMRKKYDIQAEELRRLREENLELSKRKSTPEISLTDLRAKAEAKMELSETLTDKCNRVADLVMLFAKQTNFR
jgi:dsDNA-specific endonuclease/ATPase MutS2